MSYTTAVKDRTLADIAARNSKAFFNAADWTRIKENARITKNLAESLLSIYVPWLGTVDVTTAYIPTVSNVNDLLTNIEKLRLAVVSQSIPNTDTEIKDDWTAGLSGTSPTWKDANLWESTIDAIWQYFNGSSYVNCPTLTATLTILTGTSVIYVGCVETAGYQIDIQGTGALHII